MDKKYSISEVGKLFNLAPSALRYYESLGLMEKVKKDESGHRYYDENDLRRLRFIKQLRDSGVAINVIKTYVDLVYVGEHTISERKQLLIDQLEQLKYQRESLNKTINELEEVIANFENTLVKRELERRKQDKNAYKK